MCLVLLGEEVMVCREAHSSKRCQGKARINASTEHSGSEVSLSSLSQGKHAGKILRDEYG